MGPWGWESPGWGWKAWGVREPRRQDLPAQESLRPFQGADPLYPDGGPPGNTKAGPWCTLGSLTSGTQEPHCSAGIRGLFPRKLLGPQRREDS